MLEVKMCLYRGYNGLYNINLHRLTCKMRLLQKVEEKEIDHVFPPDIFTSYFGSKKLYPTILF